MSGAGLDDAPRLVKRHREPPDCLRRTRGQIMRRDRLWAFDAVNIERAPPVRYQA
jgi:hypothetical protein